jgi:hypothetical protein
MSGQNNQQSRRNYGSQSSQRAENVVSMADYIVRSGRAAERFFLKRLRYEGQGENVVVWIKDYRPQA